ncbi:hypothetical protein UU9_03038 [Rhodanobacter fulvus Jip2]|uniref:Uncharacterized protein n=1 Tax=Rhodanobacter fulvus Jip2 TaxID=1163408 RepID=I4VXM5_9GAMM|nr:hypothetical protein [Rhodanobacter fulvus]EIL91966.1 hypothetical protein UU9_03038 [Rhodanobacter fulvus Jip2]
MTNSPIRPIFARATLPRVRQTALAFPLIAAVFASGVQAQVLVTDSVAISAAEEGFKSQLAQSVEQYIKQGMQYAKQIEQFRQQILQYEQILTSIQSLVTGGITLTSEKLTPINDASNLIQQSCPGASSSGLLGSMKSLVTSSFDNSITKNQQTICVQIVLVKIDKYNKTVKMVNDTQQFGQELQQITSTLKKMTTQGDSDRVTANTAAHSEQLAWEMQDWQSQMKKDDAIISTLEQQQGILAKIALNGHHTILGNVVQAAAFAKAFD